MAAGKWISDLSATTPIDDAARRVLGIRLETVRDYLGLALREADSDHEHIHQLRVGTRRAGAALTIFAGCLSAKAQKSARRDLRSLRRAAGAARDWDVFLLALTETDGNRKPRETPGRDLLVGYALAQRDLGLAQLRAANPDYPFAFEKLLADTLHAITCGEGGPQTLLELAQPVLQQQLRALEHAASADLGDYEHLHQVRILGKRLRYAMEVFADCFPEEFRTTHYTAVEQMQEILGRANDSHVSVGWLQALRARLAPLLPGDAKRYYPKLDKLIRFHTERLPRERAAFESWWRGWHETQAADLRALLGTPPLDA